MVTFVHPIQFFVWMIIIDFMNAYSAPNRHRTLLYMFLAGASGPMGLAFPLSGKPGVSKALADQMHSARGWLTYWLDNLGHVASRPAAISS
jgi:hypothetical protein